MKTVFTALLLVFYLTGISQPPKTSAKELFEGKLGAQKVQVYIETIQTYSTEFKSYVVTEHKGWYRIANGKKVKIVNDWEGSGPMEFKPALVTEAATVLSLEDYTEKFKKKTLEGWLLQNNQQKEIKLVIKTTYK